MTAGQYIEAELMGRVESFTTTCSGPDHVLGSPYDDKQVFSLTLGSSIQAVTILSTAVL